MLFLLNPFSRAQFQPFWIYTLLGSITINWKKQIILCTFNYYCKNKLNMCSCLDQNFYLHTRRSIGMQASNPRLLPSAGSKFNDAFFSYSLWDNKGDLARLTEPGSLVRLLNFYLLTSEKLDIWSALLSGDHYFP